MLEADFYGKLLPTPMGFATASPNPGGLRDLRGLVRGVVAPAERWARHAAPLPFPRCQIPASPCLRGRRTQICGKQAPPSPDRQVSLTLHESRITVLDIELCAQKGTERQKKQDIVTGGMRTKYTSNLFTRPYN